MKYDVSIIFEMWKTFIKENNLDPEFGQCDFHAKLGQLLSWYQQKKNNYNPLENIDLNIPTEFRNPQIKLYLKGNIVRMDFKTERKRRMYEELLQKNQKVITKLNCLYPTTDISTTKQNDSNNDIKLISRQSENNINNIAKTTRPKRTVKSVITRPQFYFIEESNHFIESEQRSMEQRGIESRGEEWRYRTETEAVTLVDFDESSVPWRNNQHQYRNFRTGFGRNESNLKRGGWCNGNRGYAINKERYYDKHEKRYHTQRERTDGNKRERNRENRGHLNQNNHRREYQTDERRQLTNPIQSAGDSVQNVDDSENDEEELNRMINQEIINIPILNGSKY